MKRRMKTSVKTMLVLFAILINFSVVYGQDQKFSKNSLKIGEGFGISSGNRSDGIGFVHTLGYQREIWKDRLRINPNISFGSYHSINGSIFAIDVFGPRTLEYFNSVSLEANLFYDLIKKRAFSVVVAGGGFANCSTGLTTSSSSYEDHTAPQFSEYFTDFHIGCYLGAGFRINVPKIRTAFNIMPFNFYFGYPNFMGYHPKFELDIKL